MKVQRNLNWVLNQDSDSGIGSVACGQSSSESVMIQPPPVQMKMKRTELENYHLNVPDSLPTLVAEDEAEAAPNKEV